MNTPTPRTDAAWAKTFEDDEDQCRAGNAASDMREECATLERELAALAAERDQLRAALALGQQNCDDAYDEWIAVKAERDQLRAENATLRAAQKACEACDEPTAFEVRQLRARAEHAEAIVGELQELHGCSQEMVVHWCEHAANRSLGLDQARSELATERARLKEMAAELAHCAGYIASVRTDRLITWHEELYALQTLEWAEGAFEIAEKANAVLEAHDAAMKEDAK